MKYKLRYEGCYLIVDCIHHNINKSGISFCKANEKGKQKLKGEKVIGTCYKMLEINCLHGSKELVKDVKRWAVQHLHFDKKVVAELALDVVKGKVDE